MEKEAKEQAGKKNKGVEKSSPEETTQHGFVEEVESIRRQTKKMLTISGASIRGWKPIRTLRKPQTSISKMKKNPAMLGSCAISATGRKYNRPRRLDLQKKVLREPKTSSWILLGDHGENMSDIAHPGTGITPWFGHAQGVKRPNEFARVFNSTAPHTGDGVPMGTSRTKTYFHGNGPEGRKPEGGMQVGVK